jgi:hypothetical protein
MGEIALNFVCPLHRDQFPAREHVGPFDIQQIFPAVHKQFRRVGNIEISVQIYIVLA